MDANDKGRLIEEISEQVSFCDTGYEAALNVLNHVLPDPRLRRLLLEAMDSGYELTFFERPYHGPERRSRVRG